MARTDYATMMKDMMSSLPMDSQSLEAMVRSQSQLAERMAAVAIEAAQRSTDLSAKWTQDTLSKLQAASRAKAEPADYAKSVTEFMSTSAESAAEHVAAFAEIAKKVQAETLEILLAAGKEMGEDVTAAARKATTDMQQAAQSAMNPQHQG